MLMKIIWLLLMAASWVAVYRAGKSAGASEENKRCSVLVREMKEVVDQMAADTSLIISSASAAMRIAEGNKDALGQAYQDGAAYGMGMVQMTHIPTGEALSGGNAGAVPGGPEYAEQHPRYHKSALTGEAVPVGRHVLYTDADKDRPESICDGNGQVCLAMCKVCRLAESDLLDNPACSGSAARGGYAEDQQHCCAQPGEEHPCADCPVREP